MFINPSLSGGSVLSSSQFDKAIAFFSLALLLTAEYRQENGTEKFERWWVLPLDIILAVFGLLIIYVESSVLAAPFVYTLF